MTKAKKKLLSLILEKSYREGDFTLSSGQKSPFYIDLKPTLLDPRGAEAFGECALEWIQELGITWGGVAGLTLGADPMVMAVSIIAHQKASLNIPAAMIRKEVKGHGSSKIIEGVENLNAKLPILILEDVVTTGGSALKAHESLQKAGFVSTHVLAVVDREAGGVEKFKERNLKLVSLFKLSEVQLAFASRAV